MKRLAVATCFLLLALGAVAQPADEAPGIRVAESALGTGVAERMLVETADSFSTGDRAYLWCRLIGGNDGDIIRHVWYYGDHEVQTIELPVGGDHWRTWSYKTLFGGTAGDWRVEILDADDRLLAEHAFTVTDKE